MPRRLVVFTVMLIIGVLTAAYIREKDYQQTIPDVLEKPDYLLENQLLYELQSQTDAAKMDHERWCPAIPAVSDSNLKETIKRIRRESGVE